MISENIVFEVLKSGLGALGLSLLIGLVVLDGFLEVEGITSSEEHILDGGDFSYLFGLLLLVTLLFTELVGVGFIFFFVFSAGLPLGITELFVLGLLVLVDGDLNVGVSCVDGAGRSNDLAVDNTIVDLFEEFNILVNVNGGGPLVSNTENELLEEVLVHDV